MIRPAAISDIDAVQKCAVDAYTRYEERIGKKPAPMVADFLAIQMAGNLYVLEVEKKVVGFIAFYPINDVMHLENVAVSPSEHGKGYGSLLVEFAESAARGRGFEIMELYTNEKMTENFSFYEYKRLSGNRSSARGWLQPCFLSQDTVTSASPLR